jgi:ABC-2 type transport system permease protein
MRWFLEVTSLEIRRIAASRLEFWVRVLLAVVVQATVAYFLWREVLAAGGKTSVAGYDLQGLVFYYVLAALVFNCINPDFDLLARDIYDGGLNRFLVYPISVFQFKMAGVFARYVLSAAQIILVWGILSVFAVFTPATPPSFTTLPLGLLSCLLAALTFFIMVYLVELIAFWIDNAWNLRLIMQFTTNLLSGALIPVAAFPEWLRNLSELTPFPWLISFPIECLLGRAGLVDLGHCVLMLSVWCGVLALAIRIVWRRGRLRYSGIGL